MIQKVKIILNITYDEFIEYYERYSSDEIFIVMKIKQYIQQHLIIISDEVKENQ